MISYFLPEVKEYIAKNKIKVEILLNKSQKDEITKSLPPRYKQKRKIGENDNYICKLIRNDDIDKFISYVNQNQISVNSIIKKSIYETNSLLMNKEVSLIEYASFFGSIQIFKFLFLNKAKIPNSVGLFSMHGYNPEIIKIISEYIEVKQEWFNEAIKCHHNEIVNYLIEEYQFTIEFSYVCESYNFLLFQKEFINKENFGFFCKCDYISIVEFFISSANINVNSLFLYNNDENKDPPLCIAALYNNNEIAQLLVQCNTIDVNLGMTIDKREVFRPLSIAIDHENIEIVKILLKCESIDVNKKYWFLGDQNTPLEQAIINQNVEIVELLLKNKDINVNEKSFKVIRTSINREEKTPLHSAIKTQNIEIIKLLLNHKNIDVNAKSIYHYNENDSESISATPLYQAIQMGNIEIIKLLLESKKLI